MDKCQSEVIIKLIQFCLLFISKDVLVDIVGGQVLNFGGNVLLYGSVIFIVFFNACYLLWI